MTEELPAEAKSQAERIQADPLYAELKKRTRRITVPLVLAFVVVYGTYVGTSVYASQTMASHHVGSLSVAWILTFVATAMPIVIAVIFMAYSDRVLDPINHELRERVGASN